MRGVRRTFLPLGELPGAGNRIASPAREWAATSEPLECEPSATAGAVYGDGLQRVVRTRRIKFAGAAEKWSQGDLIGAEQEAQQSCGNVQRGRGRGPMVFQVVVSVGRGSR